MRRSLKLSFVGIGRYEVGNDCKWCEKLFQLVDSGFALLKVWYISLLFLMMMRGWPLYFYVSCQSYQCFVLV